MIAAILLAGALGLPPAWGGGQAGRRAVPDALEEGVGGGGDDAPSVSAPAARPISLQEAYALALRRSEQLAESGFTVKQLEAKIDEFYGNMRPRISFIGTDTLQQIPANLPSSLQPFFVTNNPQADVNLQQPIFVGLRDWLVLKSTKLQKDSAVRTYERVRQQIYQDVAAAYVNLLIYQDAVKIDQGILSVVDGQVRTLEHFVRIGRVPESQLLAAQVQKAQVASQIETVKGQEQVAQVVLQFLTGLDDDFAPQPVSSPSLQPLKGYLEAAERRPDVEGARDGYESARLMTTSTGRQRWPTLNFNGDYYPHRPVGFTQNIHWVAGFTLQFPLYDGGVIGAQVREAEAQERTAEQALSLALRGALRDVRSAHRSLDAALRVVQADEEARGLAERSAKAQEEDYRHNLVTNIDVLQSVSALQQARLSLDQARLGAFLAYVQLEVASGKIEESER